MAKLYGVAISVIRNRGHQDINPGAVFTADGDVNTREYWRLVNTGHVREATDDEAKLYDAKVADGETPSIALGATAEEFAAANSTIGSVNTGSTAEPVVTKNAEPADDSKKTEPAGSKTAVGAKTGTKKDDDI